MECYPDDNNFIFEDIELNIADSIQIIDQFIKKFKETNQDLKKYIQMSESYNNQCTSDKSMQPTIIGPQSNINTFFSNEKDELCSRLMNSIENFIHKWKENKEILNIQENTETFDQISFEILIDALDNYGQIFDDNKKLRGSEKTILNELEETKERNEKRCNSFNDIIDISHDQLNQNNLLQIELHNAGLQIETIKKKLNEKRVKMM